MKTSYYKLALLHHPDRVDESQKEVAKTKFGILHNAYSILSNVETKKAYDAGDFDVIPAAKSKSNWEHFVQTIDPDDIEVARKNYQGSLKEQNDIIRETINGKGSMVHLLNEIPFMRNEDETRMIDFIKNCMLEGKIPKMQIRKLRK